MALEGFIARRYLRAKRKQAFIGVISLITLLGITVGVAALNLGLAVHNGIRQEFLTSLIGETGILYIDRGWQNEGFTLDEIRALLEQLEELPQVAQASYSRQEFSFLTHVGRRSAPAQLYGIMAEQEAQISPFLADLQSGSLELLPSRSEGDRPGLLLGCDLARRLGAQVGDVLRVTFLRPSSPSLLMHTARLRQKTYRVAGTFQTGSSEIDQYRAYLDLGELMAQLDEASVQTVQVKLASVDQLDGVKAQVRAMPGLPAGARIFDLREANLELLRALELEKWGTTLIISLIILIVALNLVSALTMLVMEKHRDIGVLMAMGARRQMIIRIFLIQGMTLSFWGTTLGTLVGVALAQAADHYRWIELKRSVYEVLGYLPFAVDWRETLLVAVGSLAISLLASIYPARQAASLDPVEALRYD